MTSHILPDTNYRHVDVLCADVRRVCCGLSIEPENAKGQINARMSVERTQSFEIAKISLNARAINRRKLDIKRDAIDNYLMIFQEGGHALVQQGGDPILLRSGDIVFIDTTRESSFDFQGKQGSQLSLHFSRDELSVRFGTAIYGGLNIKRDEPLARALRAIVARSLEVSDGTNAHLLEAFHSVLGACLIDHAGDDSKGDRSQTDLLAKAEREIALRYKDPDFGPVSLATKLGISLRSLQRGFAKVDKTPRQAIADYRLNQALSALCRQAQMRKLGAIGKAAHKTTSEIAFAQGFNDLSYFYQQFRDRYGQSPGALAAAENGPGDGFN